MSAQRINLAMVDNRIENLRGHLNSIAGGNPNLLSGDDWYNVIDNVYDCLTALQCAIQQFNNEIPPTPAIPSREAPNEIT